MKKMNLSETRVKSTREILKEKDLHNIKSESLEELLRDTNRHRSSTIIKPSKLYKNEGVNIGRSSYIIRLVKERRTPEYKDNLEKTILHDDFSWIKSLEDIIFLLYKKPVYICLFKTILSQECLISIVLNYPKHLEIFEEYLTKSSLIDMINYKPAVIRYMRKPTKKELLFFLCKTDAQKLVGLEIDILLDLYKITAEEFKKELRMHYDSGSLSLFKYRHQMSLYQELFSKDEFESLNSEIKKYNAIAMEREDFDEEEDLLEEVSEKSLEKVRKRLDGIKKV